MTDQSNQEFNDLNDDQTIFASEVPILEDGMNQVLPLKPQAAVVASPKKSQKLVFLVGVTMMVVLGIAGVWLMSRQNVQTPTFTLIASPSPTTQAAQIDSFTKKFTEIKNNLKAADPSNEQLSFPPVDLTIGLQFSTKTKN